MILFARIISLLLREFGFAVSGIIIWDLNPGNRNNGIAPRRKLPLAFRREDLASSPPFPPILNFLTTLSSSPRLWLPSSAAHLILYREGSGWPRPVFRLNPSSFPTSNSTKSLLLLKFGDSTERAADFEREEERVCVHTRGDHILERDPALRGCAASELISWVSWLTQSFDFPWSIDLVYKFHNNERQRIRLVACASPGSHHRCPET